MEDQLTLTTFSQVLRAERRAHGLGQVELAKRIGTTQQAIAGWEHGKSQPRPETLCKLIEVFGADSPISAVLKRGEMFLPSSTMKIIDSKAHNQQNTPPLPLLSAQARQIGALFDLLPEDLIIRARTLSACTVEILKGLQDIRATIEPAVFTQVDGLTPNAPE